MVREGPAQPVPPPKYGGEREEIPARRARGGEIILTTPASRIIFIAGLAIMAAVAIAAFV